MHTFAAAGAAFLLAVLWFDLMFDVQVRRHPVGTLPPSAAIVAQIVEGVSPWWIGWVSLVIAGSGFGPTLLRTVPNARRLGRAEDTPEEQTRLARAIWRAHVLSVARMFVVLCLQLIAR